MSETDNVSRPEKLEHDNRPLKDFALVTIILAGALGCIYATRPVPLTITAHGLEVVDNSGNLRARVRRRIVCWYK